MINIDNECRKGCQTTQGKKYGIETGTQKKNKQKQIHRKMQGKNNMNKFYFSPTAESVSFGFDVFIAILIDENDGIPLSLKVAPQVFTGSCRCVRRPD